MRRLALLLCAAGLAACSFITAGTFTECNTDADCGNASACSQHYCLPLPDGCTREVLASKDPGDTATRIPVLALLPLKRGTVDADNSEEQALNAAKLAMVEANSGLDVEDRGRFGLFLCDVPTADDAKRDAEWFIENVKVGAVLVDGSENLQNVAQSPVRIDAGTFLISPNATATSLAVQFSLYGNLWRVAPPDSQQQVVLADLVREHLPDAGGTKVGIVYIKNTYGEGLGPGLGDELSDAGFPVVRTGLNEQVMSAENEAISQITNLANTEAPDALVVVAFPSSVIPLVKRARELPAFNTPGFPWFFADAAKDPDIATVDTVPAIQGAFGTAPAQGAGNAYPLFRDAFRGQYGFDPDSFSFTSHAYDAMWTLMLAAEYAEGTPADRSAITGPRMAGAIALLSDTSLPAVRVAASNWSALSSAMAMGAATNLEGASGPLDFNLDAGFAPSQFEIWKVAGVGSITIDHRVSPP